MEIDPKAINRIKGESWGGLRPLFIEVSNSLLEVNDGIQNELTTIYVKFFKIVDGNQVIFAVVWIKTSKQMVIGLSLPENIKCDSFVKTPKGCIYKGLTKHLVIESDGIIPSNFKMLCKKAFDFCLTQHTE